MVRPVILCVLDGFGIDVDGPGNAVTRAHMPHMKSWLKTYPLSLLEASGEAVGLPQGQMGNSEVGHMTMGAGRAIFQSLPRIQREIEGGTLETQPALVSFLKELQTRKGALHIMGLFSDGGVHSHTSHLWPLIQLAESYHIPLNLHLFLDGRDTPPDQAKKILDDSLQKLGQAKIQTIMGRFYGMDRDKRHARTELAFKAIALGDAPLFTTPLALIEDSYASNVYDEFIKPHKSAGYTGIKPNDGIFAFNFRADRMRQITEAFVSPSFSTFDRGPFQPVPFMGMTEYAEGLNPHMQVLFAREEPEETLGECLSKSRLKQLRLAETEKYAHVTFFFNGGIDAPFEGEDRILVASPNVETYDHCPEMSAEAITDKLLDALKQDTYDFILVNYANPDMVGHTGDMQATIRALEVLDMCLGRVAAQVLDGHGMLLITADHGNAECMVDPTTHKPHTAHTSNLVPFMAISKTPWALKPHGTLADIAPTVMDLMGLKIPIAMKGCSLHVS